MMKKFCALLLGLLLLLSGCAGELNIPDDDFNGGLGDTLRTAFVDFSATELQLTGEPLGEGDQVIEPGEDRQLAVIRVRVENNGAEAVTLYYDEFDLAFDEGKRFPEPPVLRGQLAEETVLDPGESVEGDLVFLVPTGTKTARLIYDEYYRGDVKGDSYTVHLSLG